MEETTVLGGVGGCMYSCQALIHSGPLTEGCVELLSEGGAGGAEKAQISESEMVVFIAIVN